MANLDDIKKQLSRVPTEPGVYLWKDKDGQVIYVGKAKQLRARMRQYVNFQDDRAKIPLLVDQIASFDYIVTNNEHESLILEKNLINQYSPFFNADYKDDKSYPFIALTTEDAFPAIKFTREKHKAGTTYYGPYTDSRAARKLIEVARRVVPICSASCATWRSMKRAIDTKGLEAYSKTEHKPCFDCHVGIGPGACCGAISSEDYLARVAKVERFLKGKQNEFIEGIQTEMSEAAAELDFERAGRLKARIDAISALNEKQHVVSSSNLDADIIGIFREETIAGVHVLIVREGRVLNSNEFVLNKGLDVPDDDILHNFLLRYYDVTTSIPREVVCAKLPEDHKEMSTWLSEKLGNIHRAKVRFTAPEKGERHHLLSLAEVNAKHALMRYKVRTNYDDERINDALLQLESALALDGPPMRIECFDISTIHGSYTVASMVVFSGGRPDKNQYRRFKIRTPLDEANDFVSMQEVLGRRYAPDRMADERFGSKPDLLILDGGKPQLSAAMEQLSLLGLEIPMAGLAKRDEELFVPWQESGPVVLPTGSSSLYLVKQVRDEAHRFAISFHRELRGKGMNASILDDVAGIGPVRKKALMKAFRSFKGLREAGLQDLLDAHIVPEEVAHELYEVLQQYNEQYEK